jgi:hypothetical protein
LLVINTNIGATDAVNHLGSNSGARRIVVAVLILCHCERKRGEDDKEG